MPGMTLGAVAPTSYPEFPMWSPPSSLSVARNRPKGKIDIGGELVRRGWALAYRQYSLTYVRQEAEARVAMKRFWGCQV